MNFQEREEDSASEQARALYKAIKLSAVEKEKE
jgi:hypothetical protein